MARGFYRSICTALHDDPEYQRLSPQARHTLLTLRSNRFNNAAGIYILDNGSFVTLMDHTGYNFEELEKALAELCDREWIAFQYPILWVIKSLEEEPNISLTNPKHKKAVISILESLPKLNIIANFCKYYSLSIPSGYPSEGVSLPLEYPIRYRRVLGKNKESINKIPAQPELQFSGSGDFPSASPDSKNLEITETAILGKEESGSPPSSPPPQANDEKEPDDWMGKILSLQIKKWKSQPLIPSMINKLVNEHFNTYAALYCAIEAVKDKPEDAAGYFVGIGNNAESVAKYNKLGEVKFPPDDFIGQIGCKIKGITQSKTGT